MSNDKKLVGPKEPPILAAEIRPAQAVPPLNVTALIGGYDTKDGTLRVWDLDSVRQAKALAERLHATDRIDGRNAITATIAAGAAVAAVATAALTVPADEVWFLNRVTLTSPAESGGGVGDIVQVNFRVSKWPDPAGNAAGKLYNAAGLGTIALDVLPEDFPAQGELGEELRLEPGDVLTLVATLTGVPAGANLTATLTPFGRKGKYLDVA